MFLIGDVLFDVACTLTRIMEVQTTPTLRLHIGSVGSEIDKECACSASTAGSHQPPSQAAIIAGRTGQINRVIMDLQFAILPGLVGECECFVAVFVGEECSGSIGLLSSFVEINFTPPFPL